MLVEQTNKIRIAAVNLESVYGNPQINLARINKILEKMACKKPQLVLLPELCLTGYKTQPEILQFAEPIPGQLTAALKQLSVKYNVILIAGLVEQGRDNRYYISQVAVQGRQLLGIYRKTHLTINEKKIFAPGQSVPVFQAAGTCIGLQCCYDSHFPLLSARQAEQGAEILLIHFATPKTDKKKLQDRFYRFLPARAYDNSCFVVCCNATGRTRNRKKMIGISLVIDPQGKILARQISRQEKFLMYDIDLELVRKRRRSNLGYFLKNRRNDLY